LEYADTMAMSYPFKGFIELYAVYGPETLEDSFFSETKAPKYTVSDTESRQNLILGFIKRGLEGYRND